jgi:hypothetical protein
MDTLDLKTQLKRFYAPSAREVELIDVPEFQFVMLDGAIRPGQTPSTSPEFEEGIGALYGAAYSLKFASKLRKENPIDYPVMALEGLWWMEGGEIDISRPDNWRWTLMILQPDHISQDLFQEAIRQLQKKRPGPAPARLRLERFCEGLCLQTMHLGPYSEEPRTIERMKAFAQTNGYTYRGKHHEIYLGDPRRAAPEKLKTILRQPVRTATG